MLTRLTIKQKILLGVCLSVLISALAVGGMNLTLLYHPSGATDGNGEPINPHVDGDDLVNRIEKNDPAYNWGRRPKNRPFFRNFVEEMLDGRAEETLVRAMNGADPTLELAEDTGMIREEDDWR